MYYTAAEFTVVVACPGAGMTDEDFRFGIRNDCLIITVKPSYALSVIKELSNSPKGIMMNEIATSEYVRTIPLPFSIETKSISKTIRWGLITVVWKRCPNSEYIELE